MNTLHRQIIEVCIEVIARQKEIVPHLAAALGLETSEVFYEWAFRRIGQSGNFLDDSWRYFFHGLECDLENTYDGRFLRIDFGPGGALDAFTKFGILQFVMTAKSPWKDFGELKRYFAKENPPFDRFSGDYSRFFKICEEMFENGFFEYADENLLEFRESFTTVEEIGLRNIKFPADVPERKFFDCMAAGRLKISEKGLRLIDDRA